MTDVDIRPDQIVRPAEIVRSSYRDDDMFEILRREKTTPPFSVAGVICDRGTMITGLEGSGKSTIVAHLTHALATGQSHWCGLPITTDRAMTVEVACTDVDGPAEYADLWEKFGGSAKLRAMAINDSIDWDALVEFLVDRRIDLFVLDNLMGALEFEDGGDVKENWHASPIVRGLKAVRNAGIIPVLVHHTSDTGDDPKSKKRTNRRPMGAKKYVQWARHVVTLDETGDGLRSLTIHKSNYRKRGDVVAYLKFRPDHPELGEFMISRDPDGEERAAKRKQDREAATLDRNTSIARWIVENCQGMGRNDAANAIAAEFELNAETVKADLSGRRKYGALVVRNGTAWTSKAIEKLALAA